MTYEEKGKWIYMVTSLLGFVAYIGVLLKTAEGKSLSEVDYAPILLWVLGLTIATTIVAQILLAIVKPHDADRKDQRDKDINHRGDLIGGMVLGITMMVPFLMVLNNMSHFAIAHTMYGAYVLSAVVSSAIKVVAYRRGM